MSTLITSARHPLIKHWIRLREDRHYRRAHTSLLLVGSSLIEEIAPTASFKALITAEKEAIASFLPAPTYLLPAELLRKISGLPSFQGRIAEVALPLRPTTPCSSLIVCDQISDPGNLGTLMRSALAFGWQGIFLLTGSCDPFHEKVLRASRGAPFKLKVQEGSWSELKQLFATYPMHYYAADMQGLPITHMLPITPTKRIALFLGNEGQGLSQESQQWCQPIAIPMQGAMESLNVAVAGSILMYLLQPQGPS